MSLERYSNLSAAFSHLSGQSVRQWQTQAVSGGCIHRSAIYTLADGQRYFVKQNSLDKLPTFEHETDGLQALSATSALPCAQALALVCDNTHAYLILAVIESGTKSPHFWADFGQSLATLHLNNTGNYFGWQHDNTIGRIAQRNTPHDNWIDFFNNARLAPQFTLAQDKLGAQYMHKAQRLMARLDKLISPPPKPQLIHGDLWSGNFMVNQQGKAVLIDPAVYYGHGEADLAMTQLFGGFSAEFYEAYQSINPLDADYPQRADIYNLYHLLNHLNLFGNSYLPAVQNTLQRYS